MCNSVNERAIVVSTLHDKTNAKTRTAGIVEKIGMTKRHQKNKERANMAMLGAALGSGSIKLLAEHTLMLAYNTHKGMYQTEANTNNAKPV